jgi:hypothetical protein
VTTNIRMRKVSIALLGTLVPIVAGCGNAASESAAKFPARPIMSAPSTGRIPALTTIPPPEAFGDTIPERLALVTDDSLGNLSNEASRSANLAVGGDAELESANDPWKLANASFFVEPVEWKGVQGKTTVIKVSKKGLAQLSMNLDSTTTAAHFGFGAYISGGVTGTATFLDGDGRSVGTFSLPATDQFTRVAISKPLPPDAQRAVLSFTYQPFSEYSKDGQVDEVVLYTGASPVTLLSMPTLRIDREVRDQEDRTTYDLVADVEVVGPDPSAPVALENLRDIELVAIDGNPVADGGEGYLVPSLPRQGAKATWKSQLVNPSGVMSVRFWIDDNSNQLLDDGEDSAEMWMG